MQRCPLRGRACTTCERIFAGVRICVRAYLRYKGRGSHWRTSATLQPRSRRIRSWRGSPESRASTTRSINRRKNHLRQSRSGRLRTRSRTRKINRKRRYARQRRCGASLRLAGRSRRNRRTRRRRPRTRRRARARYHLPRNRTRHRLASQPWTQRHLRQCWKHRIQRRSRWSWCIRRSR